MKILKAIKTLIFSFLIGTFVNFPTYSSELSLEIENVRKQIIRSYNAADYKILLDAYEKFNKLSYSEEDWQSSQLKLKAHKWPQQSFKEVVGSHLFYPPDINEIVDYSYLNHFLKRTDIIWGLAVSTKYRNPMGRYYLAWTLDNIGSECKYGGMGRVPFVKKLYEESFSILEQSHETSPEACYILGKNHASYSWKIGIKELDAKKSLQYHEKGASLGDPRSKLESLERRRLYKAIFTTPQIKEYIDLAEKEYRAAYLVFPRFEFEIMDNNQKIFYLTKATETLPYAFIELGKLYEWISKKEEAFKSYKNATTAFGSAKQESEIEPLQQKIIATGYYQMAEMILGNLILDKELRELNHVENNKLEEAKSYLKNATDLNDPQACEQSIALYKSLYEYKGEDSSVVEIKTYLEKGMKMGLTSAYHKVRKFFPKKYEDYVKEYGGDPSSDLTLTIENFLSS